jgi:hypothetical protein
MARNEVASASPEKGDAKGESACTENAEYKSEMTSLTSELASLKRGREGSVVSVSSRKVPTVP